MLINVHAIEHKYCWIMTDYMFYWVIDKLMNLVFSLNSINLLWMISRWIYYFLWILLIFYEFVFDLMLLSIKVSIDNVS